MSSRKAARTGTKRETSRDKDLLEEAQNNAEDSPRAFVQSLGYEEVEFE